MLPNGVETRFVRLAGDRWVDPATVEQLPYEAVVVVEGDAYWVVTRTELLGLLGSGGEPSRLADLLSGLPPAAVRPATATNLEPVGTGTRVVVTEDSDVVGVVIDAPPEAPAPPPAAARSRAGPLRRAARRLGERRGGAPRRTRTARPEPAATPQDLPTDAAGTEDDTEEPWYLETHFPREVTVGSTTSLLVELNREAEADTDTSGLPVDLAPGTEVGVVVQAKEGFAVDGPAEGRLVATPDSLPLRFQLRATAEGAGTVRVLFFVDATALGAITLRPAILPADDWAADAPVASTEVVSALSVGAARPDLELLVLEEASTGNPTYSIRVTAADEALGIHLQEFGPVELHTDARRYFTEQFADIEGLDLASTQDRDRAQALLRSKGNHLFSTLLPPQLQDRLWEIRDRIVRVRIDSEEPHIPWELIRLSGPGEDGQVVEGKFLCEYELTRWIPGFGLHSQLTLGDFGVVVPDDAGLEGAGEEKTFLTGLAGDDRRVTAIPPSFEDLMDALAAGRHDVWHFSGHGAVRDDQDPNRAAMELGDGHRFTPEQISGTQANLGRTRPLVFFNGCRLGRAGMSLTGLGGWAARFLDVGAAVFVGAMWNVHDHPARDFSRTFYTGLLEGDTVGAATRKARDAIRQYGDATWLAYTVYGHPSAARTTAGA